MKNKLPQGVQDFTGSECYNKTLVENKLSALFSSYGYERIQPSAIEYFDTFCGENGSVDQKKMFKMTDSDGSLMVLSPDTTMQIARVAASKWQDGDLRRFFYNASSYEFDATGKSERSREFYQSGIELLGDAGYQSDVEAVALAVKLCLSLGIKDFQIELGQIDFFYGIAEGFGLDKDEQEQLRRMLSYKDMLGAELFLRRKKIDAEKIRAFLRLPLLFGSEEVLAVAETLTANKKSLAAIARLRLVLDALAAYGYGKYVSIDLSMVKANNYYSGIVFRGITRSLGQPLLDGGRYDNLSRNFGKAVSAVGFAVGIKRLLVVLERQGLLEEEDAPDVAYIVFDSLAEAKAYAAAERDRAAGRRTVRLFFDTHDEAANYCKLHHIKKLRAFDAHDRIDLSEEK